MGENGRLSRHNGSTEFEIKDQNDGSDKGQCSQPLSKCLLCARSFQIAFCELVPGFSCLVIYFSL